MQDQANSLAGRGNLFLDTLSPSSAERLLPLVTQVELQAGKVLCEPGISVAHVYFPIRSVISTVARMENGAAVEVGLTGREGLAPFSMAFGNPIGSHQVNVQIADSAWCVDAESFAQQFESDAGLRYHASLFAQYVLSSAAQFAACNRLHALEARYARWLLMASDRIGLGEFSLTQEYTSQMLGVRRAGVTHAAGEMANAGLIAYARGRIVILDRPGLAATACECYGVVNAELARLLSYRIEISAEPMVA